MHKQRHIPDYYISECAKILSLKQTKTKGVPKLMDCKRKQVVDHPNRLSGNKKTYYKSFSIENLKSTLTIRPIIIKKIPI